MPPIPPVPTHVIAAGKIGVAEPGMPGYFSVQTGDSTPGGQIIVGTSQDGISGSFLKIASPFGTNPATGEVAGWYVKVA
jgi:hypothetical protein